MAVSAPRAQNQGGVVVKHADDLDWKVSGSLPSGMATHEYHMISEDKVTHGILSLVRFSRGYVLPLHSHSQDETIFVLKGKIALKVEGRTEILKKGAYTLIGAGTAHALENVGWNSCEILVSFAGPVDFKGLYPVK